MRPDMCFHNFFYIRSRSMCMNLLRKAAPSIIWVGCWRQTLKCYYVAFAYRKATNPLWQLLQYPLASIGVTKSRMRSLNWSQKILINKKIKEKTLLSTISCEASSFEGQVKVSLYGFCKYLFCPQRSLVLLHLIDLEPKNAFVANRCTKPTLLGSAMRGGLCWWV